jgi:hypothetical protein
MWFKYSVFMFLLGLLFSVSVPSYVELEPDDVEVVETKTVGIYLPTLIRK